MKPIYQFTEGTTVFVMELTGDTEEIQYLHGIGIFPGAAIILIKNKKKSEYPILLEVQGANFMIEHEVAKNILVASLIESQEVIFQGNKTTQRETILQIIQEFSGHFTLRDCVRKVQDVDKTISDITVYRTTKALLEKNILQEMNLPDGTRVFELQKKHHDHIICKNCGNIIEFCSPEIEEIQKKIARQNNSVLISHTMILIVGSCAKCDSE